MIRAYNNNNVGLCVFMAVIISLSGNNIIVNPFLTGLLTCYYSFTKNIDLILRQTIISIHSYSSLDIFLNTRVIVGVFFSGFSLEPLEPTSSKRIVAGNVFKKPLYHQRILRLSRYQKLQTYVRESRSYDRNVHVQSCSRISILMAAKSF